MRRLPYEQAKPLVLGALTDEWQGIREILHVLRFRVSYYMARKILLEADAARTIERDMSPGYCINMDSWRRRIGGVGQLPNA